VTDLVNSTKIYINPNANPDGTYYGGNHTVAGAIRNNANNFDLNRNYPDPAGNQYPNGSRQIETQYFMDWAEERNFVMSANFHGGAELLNYPWDYTLNDHPDKQWWIFVCTEYATSAQNNSPSGYFTDYYSGFDMPGVTEGATWYEVSGSRQDYMQYYAHCREVTNEISSTKNPSASTLPNYWNYNYQALLMYIKQSHFGFRGLVKDACANIPVKAKIELVGHDGQNSHVFSALPVGNYHRPVKSGTYTIKASAPGYTDAQFTGVVISDNASVVRDFQLQPLPPDLQFAASKQFTCDGVIEFLNESIAPQDVVFTWHFGDGNSSTDPNPVHTYTVNGTYSVKLVAQSCAGNDSLVKTNYIVVSTAEPPVVADQSNCGPASFNFSASANGEVFWWDFTGAQLLETGSSFTTPMLSQTTQYLVSSFEPSPSCTGGKTDTIGGGAFATAASEQGLIFDAHKPIVINSTELFSSGSGNSVIKLLDNADNELANVNVSISAGHNIVPLDIPVPQGNGFKLVIAQTSAGLYINNTSPSNAGYPFDLCALMTITGSTQGNSYYHYFYNIEITEQATVFGALSNNTSTGGYFTNSNSHGLYFNCEEEVTLKSVKVYANSAGNRTITLRDGADNVVESQTVFIPNGESRVELDMVIPQGDNLKLMGPGTPNLWRDGAQNAPTLPYPFEVGDVISITGNSANNLRYYYYFYDWEVEKSSGCESQKIPVTAHIHTTPQAGFSWSEFMMTVTFTNFSSGGGSYLWDFGDGNSSNDVNPAHTYSSTGDYTVILTQTNDCGVDTFAGTLQVTDIEQYSSGNSIQCFPNPFNDNLTIKADVVIRSAELYSLQGRMLIRNEFNQREGMLNTAALPSGAYILRLISEGTAETRLIMKQ
jgi:PKD repeat protein